MLVPIAVGLALILFGGLVLLRFADRPGGTLAWLGLEVSSIGAGLPSIALGVVTVAVGSVRSQVGDGAAPAPTRAVTTPADTTTAGGGDCIAGFLADIPAERRETLGVGVYDRVVIGTTEDQRPPVGLRLTERETPVGAVRVVGEPDGAIRYPEAVVDARCAKLAPEAIGSVGGDVDGRRDTWSQYGAICIDSGPRSYILQLGAGADLSFGFSRGGGCSPT